MKPLDFGHVVNTGFRYAIRGFVVGAIGVLYFITASYLMDVHNGFVQLLGWMMTFGGIVAMAGFFWGVLTSSNL